ncbi:hypothetical protein Tco_0286151 [Tanacetum coccineum]
MVEEDVFLVDDVKGMSDSLFDVYTNVESAKELWDLLESKYMVEDSSSKNFLNDFKHTLKHGKDDLSLVQLGRHLHIEESLRAQDSDKGKGIKMDGPSVNMTEEDKNGNFKRDCRSGKKDNANVGGSGKGSKDQSQDQGSVALEFSSGKTITLFNMLYVPKLHKNLVSGPMLNKCGYKQVYESDKYILSKSGVFVRFGYYNNESRDAIFNENHFSSISRPKDIMPNLEETQRGDHSDDVPNEIP